MDWTNGLYGFMTSPSLNGSTAPNSSTIPVSTPVNTTGNPNSSGSSFGSFFSGLASFGKTAADAYATVTGRKPTSSPTSGGPSGPSSISLNLPSWAKWAIGGVVLVGVVIAGVLLFRKK